MANEPWLEYAPKKRPAIASTEKMPWEEYSAAEVEGAPMEDESVPTGPESYGDVFNRRLEEAQGVRPGLDPENEFGGPQFINGIPNPLSSLRDFASGGAHVLEHVGAAANTGLEMLDDAAEATGLADLPSVVGIDQKLLPGSMLGALGEAFPLGGAELGVVNPAAAAASSEYRSAVSRAQQRFQEGATRQELDQIVTDAGAVPFGPELDEAIAVRDSGGQAGIADLEAGLAKEAETFVKNKAPEPTAEDVFKTPEPEPEVVPSTVRDPEFRKSVEDKVFETIDGWQNAPEIKVVNTVEDIEDPMIRASAEEAGIGDVLGGVGPDGKVYLFADNIKSPDEVPAIVFHESLGHYGLSQRYGEDLDFLLNDMYENSKSFKSKVDTWVKKNPEYVSHYDGTDNPTANYVNEVLAEMSEKGQIPVSMMNTLKNYVKDVARKMGINLEYSDREIMTILGMAHKSVVDGTGAPTGASVIQPMRRRPPEDREIGKYGSIDADNIRSDRDIDELLKVLDESNPKTYQSKADTIRQAKAMGLTPGKLAKGMDETGLAARIDAGMQVLTNQLEKVAKLQDRLDTDGYSAKVHGEFLKQMATLDAVHAKVAGNNSEVGRALNILNRMRTANFNADAMIRFMKEQGNEVLGDPENFMRFAKQLSAAQATGGTPAAIKMAKAAFKPKAEDYIFSLWYNSLLSSPATHTANFVGNGLNFMTDLATHGLAAVGGQTKRWSPNTERVMGREVVARVWGTLAAMKQYSTWKDTYDSFKTATTGGIANTKTGGSLTPISDALGVKFGKGGKVIGGISEIPTRALAASDEWWRNVIQLSNVYGMAVRSAGKKGLKGAAFWTEVSDLINNPTTSMLEKSSDWTKVTQFLDKPSIVGRAIGNFQTPKPTDNIPARGVRGLSKIILPFVNTPDALIRTTIRNSPLGVLDRYNIQGFKTGGADRDLAIARVAGGSALAAYVAAKAYEGLITGDGPKDPQERKKWETTHQPNSIKIGDDWYSIAGLEPLSTNVLAVATLVERVKDKDDDESWPAEAAHLAVKMADILTDSSYLESLKASKGQNEEASFDNWLAGLAASVTTPAIVRKFNQDEDGVARNTTGDGSLADRVSGRIAAGWNPESLPEKYDTLGRPIPKGPYLGPDIASRVQIRPDETDPAVIELDRLGAVPRGVQKDDASKNLGRNMDAAELESYQYLSGQYILESVREAMATPEWEAMTDKERTDEVADIAKDMRKLARDELFPPEEEETETADTLPWEDY